MKKALIVGFKLAFICAIVATLLGFVNGITYPKIQALKQQAVIDALSVINKTGVIGEKEVVEGDGVVSYYYPVSENGSVTNYILGLKGAGYGGDLIILANYKLDGEVIDAKLMEDQETPGLGKNAEKSSYMKKFIGSGSGSPVPVKKNQLSAGDADAVGGATITFTGVAKALEYGSEYAKKLGGEL